MKKGTLIVLSAPSGTGKTSICKELLDRNKNWKFSKKGKIHVENIRYFIWPSKLSKNRDEFGTKSR